MKNLFFFLLVALLFNSCSNDSNKLNEIDWLEGSWKAEVQGREVLESWKRENDSTWQGESAFLQDGKTLFTEVMSIRIRDGKLVFISAVSDQNDAEEVTFIEKSIIGNKIVFENAKHDFPQQITYELKNENEMLAYISGDLNGKKERIDFNFIKMK